MPADDGIAFLLFAKSKEEEAMLFQRWLVQAQFEMSFDEFKDQLMRKPKKDEEILKDVENIMKGWDQQNGTL